MPLLQQTQFTYVPNILCYNSFLIIVVHLIIELELCGEEFRLCYSSLYLKIKAYSLIYSLYYYNLRINVHGVLQF